MKTISLEIDSRGVATLLLNRPEKRNAMNAEMIAELTAVADRINADHRIRVVVLVGTGDVFCAGGDLGWMRVQIDSDRQGRIAQAQTLALMLKALNELHKPLIARVHADVYGGGLGLLAVCDSVIAVDSARFAFTETKLGLIPATISPYVIARMGEGAARRVFMSAERFDAPEASRLGLVRSVVSSDALDGAIDAEVAPYLTVSIEAVKRSKQLARGLGAVIDQATIDGTIEALADAWETEDAKEGIDAFLTKRPARWAR